MLVYNTNVEDITKKEVKQDFNFNGREYKANDDVAFFYQELYILKLENKLLGDYDQTGKYSLPDDVFKTLTNLKKTILKKENEDVYLKAECGFVEFKFVVRLSQPIKEKKLAQLYLVETMSSVVQQGSQIVSLVASYFDVGDSFFEEKYKKAFNIVADEQDGKKEENQVIAKAIIEKLKFENKIYVNYLLQSRSKDKLYVEKLLKALSIDQTGHAALKKYEALLLKHGKMLNPNDKDYYRKLKQILDEVLEEERKVLSNNVALILNRLRVAYVRSNAPIIEVLKVSVEEKKKEIEKEIKLGGGMGQLKFNYYKGVSEKGSSKKEDKKKHPNFDKPKNKDEAKKAVEMPKDNWNEILAKNVAAYVSYDESSYKKTMIEKTIESSNYGDKVFEKTTEKVVNTAIKPVIKSKSQTNNKTQSKTKEESKESVFGSFLG